MKKRQQWGLCAVKWLFLPLLSSVMVQGTVRGEEVAGQFDARVEVTTPRPALFSCEPAVLNVTVTNADARDIRFAPFYPVLPSGIPELRRAYTSDPLTEGALRVWIRQGPEDEYVRVAPCMDVDMLFPRKDSLRQGEVRRVPMSILMRGGESQRFLFPSPGTYMLKLSFPFEYGDEDAPLRAAVESNPVEFTVSQAVGRVAQALAIWQEADPSYALEGCGMGVLVMQDYTKRHGMQPFGSERYALFDTLRAEYPDTIYGQYCLYFATFQTPGAVTMLGTPPKEKYGENVAVIEGILSKNPDFPLADRARLDLAEYKLGLSQTTDANGHVTRDAAKAAEAKAILQELVQSGKKTIATEIARQRLDHWEEP